MTSRDWLILLIASVSLLASCWLSLVGTYAALRMNRAAKRLAISNGRTVEDTAHEALLFAAGICLHIPGLRVPGCDCNGKVEL
jgi:UPF0716 family protein affecting phage T7 exclusion